MTIAYCSYCGKDHPIALCPHTYAGSAALHNLRCTYCGSNQHNIEYCRWTAAGEGNRRANPNGKFVD